MFASAAAFLSDHEVLVLVVLALLGLLAVIGVVLVLRRGSAKAPAAPPPQAEPPADPGTDAGDRVPAASWRETQRGFRRGLRMYRQQVAGSRDMTLAPWYVVLGPEGAGKTTLLAGLDGIRDAEEAATQGASCGWRFFDDAVVLDVAGPAVLRADGGRPGNGAWRAFLAALRRARPAYPADAVVLVLPATGLVDASGAPLAAAANSARILSDKLWQAQRVLGLTLPVYVVVTKCDLIPSFHTFAGVLPPRMRDSIFGWTNPNPLDMAYRTDWIDAAFGGLRADLLRTQVELFAEDPHPDIADELFRFPAQFGLLKEPLRAQLDIVFRRTAFQEALMLRGIYFTGMVASVTEENWSGAEAAGPVGFDMALPGYAATALASPVIDEAGQPTLPGSDAQVAFSRDLFATRIFKERNLARLSSRYKFERDRIELAWQVGTACAALLAVALFIAGVSGTGGLRDGFLPALSRVPEQMRAIGGSAGRAGAVEDLQRSYSRMDEDWSSPPWPPSLVSGLERRVATALSVGYNRIVMGAVRDNLVQRLAALGEDASDPVADESEFGGLRDFLGQAVLLERYAGVFDSVAGTPDLTGVPEMVKWTTGVDLSPEFMRRAATLGFTQAPSNRALDGASLDAVLRPIALADYRARASARLDRLMTGFIDHMGVGSDSMGQLRDVGLSIDAAARQDPAAGTGAAWEAVLRGLRSVGTGFSASDKVVLRNGVDFGPDLQPLLDLVGSSALFGPDTRARLAGRLRAAVKNAQPQYQPIDTAIGSLATVDMGRNQVVLSGISQSLQSALQGLFAHGFMAARSQDPGTPLAGAATRWDVTRLEGASALADDFALFRVRDLQSFPRALQPSILAAAQGRLRDNLLARVRQAQVAIAPGDTDLQGTVRAEVSAAPVLNNIARSLAEATMPADAAAVGAALGSSAAALMAQVDGALESGQFFSVGRARPGLWDNGRLDVAGLFGVPTLGAVGDLMTDQRQAVTSLVRDDAQPLLAIIAANPAGRAAQPALVDKWARLSADVGRPGDNRPDSAANRLVSFVRAELPDIDLGTCRASMSKAIAGAATDWFSGRLVSIAQAVAASCNDVLGQQASTGYRAVAASFNQLLAGRYPFSALEDRIARPATATGLGEFFQVFDREAPGILSAYQAKGGLDETSRRIAEFMAQMARVRAFTASLVPGPDNGAPSLKVDAGFRAHGLAERGSREIIDWQLLIGLDRSTNFQPATLTWRPGDPVQVKLRWAKDGFVRPVDAPGGVVDAADRSVTYRMDGPWALIALLQRFGEGPALIGTQLAFDAVVRTTLPDPARKQAGSGPDLLDSGTPSVQARVYIDIGVSAASRTGPDGKPLPEGRLQMPVFPVVAPSEGLPAYSYGSGRRRP